LQRRRAFGAIGMVLTPGPNMIYLLSRAILQGRAAGFISLLGVLLGFVTYMFAAGFGLTALLIAVPFAYETLQWSVLQPRRDLAIDGPS
jgi:threonine/homoserine/homoserine lactone efflux protein